MEDLRHHNTAEIISKIRDQIDVQGAEIDHIVAGMSSGDVNDAQLGAFAMAVLCRGLSDDAGVALTLAMRDSGDVLSWNVDGPIVDKHSTGGVGDCVSLALAPILAAAGLYVPMISGRGLGHTGGTLDKLEAIKGFSTQLPLDKMQRQLSDIGCVMAGQSSMLAPADRRLYAIRDVTGTVPSIDLITASILSKKLAAGLQHLVLDVKAGRGAFMKTPDEARALAQRLVDVANQAGCRTTALITDMDVPLGGAAGNALEVDEIIKLLSGEGDPRLAQVTRSLCVQIMHEAGGDDGERTYDENLSSGRAMEKFEQMVARQGGPRGVVAIRNSLPVAPVVVDFIAPQTNEFDGFDAYEVGMAVVGLGGGRKHQDDEINPAVGVSNIQVAEHVNKGDVLARVHADNENDAHAAIERIQGAVLRAPSTQTLIMDVI